MSYCPDCECAPCACAVGWQMPNGLGESEWDRLNAEQERVRREEQTVQSRYTIPSKKVVLNRVLYDSTTEGKVALLLFFLGMNVTYHPKSLGLRLPSGEPVGYAPDFEHRGNLLEVKPNKRLDRNEEQKFAVLAQAMNVRREALYLLQADDWNGLSVSASLYEMRVLDGVVRIFEDRAAFARCPNSSCNTVQMVRIPTASSEVTALPCCPYVPLPADYWRTDSWAERLILPVVNTGDEYPAHSFGEWIWDLGTRRRPPPSRGW